MFICVELDTEDVILWNRLDKEIAEEVGGVHVIWGSASGDAVKKIACLLPTNLFYIDTSATTKQIGKIFIDKIQSLWIGGYRLIVLADGDWHQDSRKYTAKQLPNTKPLEEELASRED